MSMDTRSRREGRGCVRARRGRLTAAHEETKDDSEDTEGLALYCDCEEEHMKAEQVVNQENHSPSC